MAFAIITEKYPEGAVKTLRTTVFPPHAELEEQARRVDAYLEKYVSQIEQKLIKMKLLAESLPRAGQAKGSAQLWYELGNELMKLCRKFNVINSRERRWLWEAIENLYATDRIKRARRGRTRNHFEYCHRLAQFPQDLVLALNWSEWSTFFDSLTVREEPRVDKWLCLKAKESWKINRLFFRRFTENLNKRIRYKDTSVLSDKELFQLYDEVWRETKRNIPAKKSH